ncbi:MAG: dihydrodipicolinate synthase family protein [Candidatus Hydrogenedentes bacterium]|nr:dihydrodipicolinate synthase family protein [Candidatus Hydrogenedentota bacterium]
MIKSRGAWSGLFPATLCPFTGSLDIDEEDLARYLSWVAGHACVKGVVVNGHTGEITSLRNAERARVTAIAVASVGQRVRVISGVCAEGSLDAIDQARAAKEAGASAILLMPPHHWLRFGRNRATAVGFVEDVNNAVDIGIVLHQYPAWTKAGYSLAEMLDIAALSNVVSIKMGTRDMARQHHDYETLRQAVPDVSIITCHDEFLLASLLEGADGALVGFAGYAPELIGALVDKALAGDLAGARSLRDRVDTLAKAIYAFGEPSADAHQRMKMAAYLTGKLASPVARPPLRALAAEAVKAMAAALRRAGEHVLPGRGAD